MPEPKKTRTRKRSSRTLRQPLRLAHPFFNNIPPADRPADSQHGQRMLSHIEGTLKPIPPIKRDGRMSLAEVIGQAGVDAIAAAGQITLQLAGDTGMPEIDTETRQESVANAMAKDYDVNNLAHSPACFLHLGDVIYGSSTSAYLYQFYRPYMHYPGKIIAIPGNHDAESDRKMAEFQRYFCAPSQTVPAIAGSIFRETMNQPGVYWCLDAPFLQVVGLYSNAAENPGYIESPLIGRKQKDWLIKTLKAIKAARDQGTRKALLFATHHPPYTSGGHSGSKEMLADIDDACAQAKIQPDAFFSGHAHSIQRYTRTVQVGPKSVKTPYIVSGCGGHGGQTVRPVNNPPGSNPVYEYCYKGWGYTNVQVTPHTLKITSYSVDWDVVQELDSVTVNLA